LLWQAGCQCCFRILTLHSSLVTLS
jgi:hypothetical protein